MKKIILLFILSLTIILNNCSQQTQETKNTSAKPVAAEEEFIKIGAIFAYTGGASFLGEPERKTAELLEKKINASGGVLGKKIKLIIKDTAGDIQKAKNAINELVEKEKVVAIIGPTTTGVSLGIKNDMNNMETLLISCAADERIVTPVEESKWVFKTPQSDRMAITKLFNLMKEKGIKKLGLITADAGFGLGGGMQARNLAPEYGIEIVADEKYSAKDPDVNTQITKIRSKNPDSILCWDTNEGSAKVVKSIRALGVEVPVFMSHGMGNAGFLKSAGFAGNGVIFPCGRLLVVDQLPDNHPQKKLLVDYKNEYTEAYLESPNTFGGHAYDALTILVEAIKNAGSTDKDKIRIALENIKNFNGTAGTFNFSDKDHNGLDMSSFCFIEVVDNNWKFLSE